MPEGDGKTNYELANSDVFSLNDRELKVHINALQAERNRLKQSVVPSVGECNTLIALARAELSARASDRKANLALWLSVTAIVVTCAVSILPILMG
jgi:hypothetical protein